MQSFATVHKPERGVMFWKGTWRVFLAGALCGAVLTASVGAAYVWSKPHPERSAADSAMYDACLVDRSGNTVVCDALMRMVARETMKQKFEMFLSAGFTKREIVQWARDQGFADSDVSDAVGISLSDLQSGKY
jgi:hypothetical protein